MIQKVLTCFTALVLTTATALAQTPVPQWDVIQEDSKIAFAGKQMAMPFKGEFKNFTANIAFDPDNLADSHVRVEVDITSVETGDDERDGIIVGKDWFNTEKFPTAVFESTGFDQQAEGQYIAKGTLTLRDVSQNIEFPFTLTFKDSEKGQMAEMNAEFTLDRSRFQLGRGDWADPGVVQNTVTMTVSVTAHRQP